MPNIPTIYADEALILRWGDSSTNGRTITLQLHNEDGEHPFRGLPCGKNGQRVMIAVTLIGDDEQPARPPEKPLERNTEKSPADKAIAKAHVLAGDANFQVWLGSDTPVMLGAPELALSAIRQRCQVASTTEFRTNPEALKRFHDLCFEYEHREMVR